MTQAVELISQCGHGTPGFLHAAQGSQLLASPDHQQGGDLDADDGRDRWQKVVAFDGIPCRRTDALLLTEARVV